MASKSTKIPNSRKAFHNSDVMEIKNGKRMANYVLLLSSMAITLVQIFSNIIFHPPIFFIALGVVACLTSIWNHGSSLEIAKIVDRVYMVVYIMMNTIIIYTVVQSIWHVLLIYSIMLSGIICVLFAMATRSVVRKSNPKEIPNPYRWTAPGNYYHLYAHVVVMIVHVIVAHRLTIDCHPNIPFFCNDEWFSDSLSGWIIS